MGMKCQNCHEVITTVSQVRGCSECQRNGSAARIHARHGDRTAIEDVVAEGGLPLVMVVETEGAQPEPLEQTPASKPDLLAKIKKAVTKARKR